MKTDLERFIELYASIGIPLKIISRRDKNDMQSVDNTANNIQVLEIGRGQHPKFGGYSDSMTEIVFDNNGKFIEQNCWEG